MSRAKYTLVVVSIITLAVAALAYSQVYQADSGQRQLVSSPSFGPRPPGLNPTGVNVTVMGILRGSSVVPSCSLSNPPCAEVNTPIYYVVINGWNYRLIFPNSTEPPDVMGQRVLVTGLFLTPSSYDTAQWTPSLYFYGDIYVQTIIYLHYFFTT